MHNGLEDSVFVVPDGHRDRDIQLDHFYVALFKDIPAGGQCPRKEQRAWSDNLATYSMIFQERHATQ